MNTEKTVTNESVINGIVGVLNEALEADPKAIQDLVNHRVKCNEKLADHPDIQVNMESEVGLLGIVCGICQRVTGKKICIHVNDAEQISKFSIM